ncbi:MAG: flagellar assembly protein A, partial [Myxococcota bacterium]|nr:flagellar assembly protein A [Myxococcota bacterium]
MSSLLPPIRISKDGLQCVVDLPWKGVKASDLTAEAVIDGLIEQGIVPDTIDTVRIANLLSSTRREGIRHKEVVVAMGRPPIPKGCQVPVAIGESTNRCIFPGSPVAVLEALEHDQEGRSVEGKALALPSRGSDPKLKLLDGVELSEDQSQVLSTCYGHPRVRGMSVGVEPGLRFDSSNMSAHMDIMPMLLSGARVSEVQVLELLESWNIEKDAIRRDVISDTIEALWGGEAPFFDLLVAEGTPPDIGSSGIPELLGDPDNSVALPGETIARRSPQRPPSSGRSLIGAEILPAVANLQVTEMAAGNGAILRDSEFAAEVFGQPTVTGLEVAVTPCIHISADQMSCRIDIFPTRVDGSPLTLDTLEKQLQDAGVDPQCIQREVLEDSLSRSHRSGLPILDVLVAQGEEAREGEAPRIESQGDLSISCVLPGDPFAARTTTVTPQTGRTVLGETLHAPEPTTPDDLPATDGFELIGDELVATVYGQAAFSDEGPMVIPALHIAEDDTQATADIFPGRLGNQPLSADILCAAFSEAGIDMACIQVDAIKAALETCREQGVPQRGVLIAKSLDAQPGKPGRVEFPTEPTLYGALSGDIIASLVDPIPASAGQSIRGQVMGAGELPPAATLEAKDGCHTSEDGKQIIADRYGEPIIESQVQDNGALHVSVEIRRGLRITKDGLMARLDIFPRRVDEAPMDYAALLEALTAQNIAPNQINQDAIEAALANALEVEVSQRDVPAATGSAAVPAEGWHIKATSVKAIGGVLPGQSIAMFTADVTPADGLTVRGEPIPVDHAPTFQPDLGLGTRMSEDGTQILADHYGRPQITRSAARVEPGVRIADDTLSCEVDLYTVDADGNPIGEETILSLLAELGIADASIDKPSLTQALTRGRETGSSQRSVVLARGQAAGDGQDGHLEPLFGPGAGCAMPGDELARVVPSTPGSEGIDILGNVLLPAHDGVDPTVQIGVGCELKPDASIV